MYRRESVKKMNVENINRLEWQEYFEQLITLTTDVQNRSGLPQDSELLTGCK